MSATLHSFRCSERYLIVFVFSIMSSAAHPKSVSNPRASCFRSPLTSERERSLQCETQRDSITGYLFYVASDHLLISGRSIWPSSSLSQDCRYRECVQISNFLLVTSLAYARYLWSLMITASLWFSSLLHWRVDALNSLPLSALRTRSLPLFFLLLVARLECRGTREISQVKNTRVSCFPSCLNSCHRRIPWSSSCLGLIYTHWQLFLWTIWRAERFSSYCQPEFTLVTIRCLKWLNSVIPLLHTIWFVTALHVH